MFEPLLTRENAPSQFIRPVGQFRFRFHLDGSDKASQ